MRRLRAHQGSRRREVLRQLSFPERKWSQKVCNFATHVKLEIDKGGKVNINPLKASKRAARGR
jgi:hypothetical protein